MKLTMYVGCEYAPGQRTGFDFDVELSDIEMSSLASAYLNHEDVRIDFKNLRNYDERLYQKIRSFASDALDDEMGEDTIKTDRRVSWGDNVEDVFRRIIGQK